MSDRQIRIVPAGSGRHAFLPLLRLADDSDSEVLRYYQTGDLYAQEDGDGRPIGMVLAIPDPDGSVELKAVAVDPSRQGQGTGTRLLAAVLADLKAGGVKRVVVGTGNAGIGPLAFYQKLGFRLWRIERDYFGPARGYPAGLEENGIPLLDMVWMDLDL